MPHILKRTANNKGSSSSELPKVAEVALVPPNISLLTSLTCLLKIMRKERGKKSLRAKGSWPTGK